MPLNFITITLASVFQINLALFELCLRLMVLSFSILFLEFSFSRFLPISTPAIIHVNPSPSLCSSFCPVPFFFHFTIFLYSCHERWHVQVVVQTSHSPTQTSHLSSLPHGLLSSIRSLYSLYRLASTVVFTLFSFSLKSGVCYSNHLYKFPQVTWPSLLPSHHLTRLRASMRSISYLLRNVHK